MIRIGFDAKRAFFNNRGLGNYSRGLIRIVSECQPDNEYFLLTPKTKGAIYDSFPENCKVIEPHSAFYTRFPSLWRSSGQIKEITELKLDIFHGLSHELPLGIKRTNARSVVTMHDLIFCKFPELYPWIDRQLYKRKYFRSCRDADKIIAISEQTKMDLMDLAGIEEQKIEVVYQGCNPIFQKKISQEELLAIKSKYNLPEQYLLNVGAIEKRKNQELIIKAIAFGNIDTPLIIVGNPTEYIRELETLIAKHHLESKIHFLTNVPTEDLPAIYQLASIFVYPSLFEGFGIPIIEAIQSNIPVITSKGSCFQETGGPASSYVSHDNVEELASAVEEILGNTEKRKIMVHDSLIYAEMFSDSNISKSLMGVYQQLL